MKIKENLAKFSLALCIVASVFIVSSCNDDEESETIILVPTISSVSPSEAAPEAVITLTGTNFSATASENSVSIGGTAAIVSAASATSITCEVPTLDAGQADITVTVDGQSSTAYTGFTVLEAVTAPTVTGFSPDNGSVGEEVIISGSDFGIDTSVVTVTINDVVQHFVSISDDEIIITLSPKTFSGNVVVSKSGLKDSADVAYTYKESYRVADFSQNEIYAIAENPKNGHVFLATGYGTLIENDAEGAFVDSIIKQDEYENYRVADIFCDVDGTLYMLQNESKAGIKYLAYGASSIETLIEEGNSYLDNEEMYDITGDDNGYLYITDFSGGAFDGYNSRILQVDIDNKSVSEIFDNDVKDEPQYIFYEDGYLHYSLYSNSGQSIQKMAIGSTTPELVYNGWVYYGMVYHPVVGLLAFTWDGASDSDETLVKVTGSDTEEQVFGYSDLGLLGIYDMELTSDGDILVGNDDEVKKIVIE